MARRLKDQIVTLTPENMDFSSRDIADIVGCLPEYVRTVWRREGLNHRSHIRYERPRPTTGEK